MDFHLRRTGGPTADLPDRPLNPSRSSPVACPQRKPFPPGELAVILRSHDGLRGFWVTLQIAVEGAAMPRRWITGTTFLLSLAASSLIQASDAPRDPEREAAQRKAFETQIRPLLAARCFKCHSDEKQSGNLRLDSKAAMLAGGDTAPRSSQDSPRKSLIVEAINYGSLEMPPSGKLPPEEIALLTEWVARGAWCPKASRRRRRFVLKLRNASRPLIASTGRSSRRGRRPGA